MEVWRLASGRHPPLSGEGARLVGGRWNSAGRPLVFASETIALCLAEALVHLPGSLPVDYVAVRLEVPDEQLERLDQQLLKQDWTADLGYTRAIGDQWLEQGRSLLLAVPSVVLPASTNILLNPLHSAAPHMKLISETPFLFDPRLRGPSRSLPGR